MATDLRDNWVFPPSDVGNRDQYPDEKPFEGVTGRTPDDPDSKGMKYHKYSSIYSKDSPSSIKLNFEFV